jgi:uncharacterized membrane protein
MSDAGNADGAAGKSAAAVRISRLRRYFFAGLLIWVPIGITVFIVRLLLELMDGVLLILPEAWRPAQLLGINIPGFGIVLALAVVLGTGFLVANLIGRRLVEVYEAVVQRIPLVRGIYSASKSFAEVLFSDTEQSLKKVLLIEYPRKGTFALGFQTSSRLEEIQHRTDSEVVCVFIPTTPNPTSGFILMVKRSEAIELDMSIDEALKMIISLGVVVPEWRARLLAPGQFTP